jgi:RNA polymerase sigma-70 factor (ECF subfamily)
VIIFFLELFLIFTVSPTGNETEDAELLKKVISGNVRAFDALVLRYKNKIYNICYRFLNGHEDALEISQEVFVRVYRSAGTFRFESKVFTWMYRIAINLCKNKIASKEYKLKRKELSITELEERKSPRVRSLQEKAVYAKPEAAYEKKERISVILSVLETLTPLHKELIILRDMKNLSYEQISELTGKKKGTVKSGLSRAREILREKTEQRLSPGSLLKKGT